MTICPFLFAYLGFSLFFLLPTDLQSRSTKRETLTESISVLFSEIMVLQNIKKSRTKHEGNVIVVHSLQSI